MQTNCLVMGKWPAHEDWVTAQRLLLEEMSKLKKRNIPSKEISFFEFMICVLFLWEKIGVRSITNANDMMDCLKGVYHSNGLFYSSRIFRKAWADTGADGNGISMARSFFKHLKDMGMVRSICGRENVLVLCSSGHVSEETRKQFYRDLEFASFVFNGSEKNKKYISKIRWMAYALLSAMREGNKENI